MFRIGSSVIVLLLFLLTAVGGCDKRPNPPGQAAPVTRDVVEKHAKTSHTAVLKDPVSQAHNYIEEGNYPLALKSSEAAFKEAYATSPESPSTWIIFLKKCQAQALMNSLDTIACYDKFFDNTKNIAIDDFTMATALRWRVIFALEDANRTEANYYFNMLKPLDTKLEITGMLPTEMRAYSHSIRAGVAALNQQFEQAADEMAQAVSLFDQSGEDNPPQLFSYLEKLADYQMILDRKLDVIDTLERFEKELRKTYGDYHPALSLPLMKTIHVLAKVGEKDLARKKWEYVRRIYASTDPKDNPPELEELYKDTFWLIEALDEPLFPEDEIKAREERDRAKANQDAPNP